MRVLCAAGIIVGVATGCAPSPGPARAVRLVDSFGEAVVENGVAPSSDAEPLVEWRFDGADAHAGWEFHEVAGLAARDGALHGRTASEAAMVWVDRTADVDEDDLLHSVEVAIQVNAGGDLSVRFDSSDEFDVGRILDNPFPWPLTTPVVAGDSVQRYTLRPSRPVSMSRVDRIVLRPVDAKGASFAIEAVRVVTRREHLAGIDSGVGWHGMDSAFRETIVTRAPESVTFSMTMPEQPWLDLAFATVEDGAATFRVAANVEGARPVLYERTISRPHRWNPARFDLAGLSGREVELTLTLESEAEGFLGFWGSPVVRSSIPSGAPADRPQGVIVILGDTLRSDHVNAWGYDRETAPVLASLADDGVRADDCVSQATWTKVSVPSIMTGLYPTTHTVSQFTDRLPAAAETMAEVFRGEGYATLALTSISFVGQFTNLHQGYEELHESASLGDSSDSKTAREYVDRLLPWLESHRDVPFFAFLHVADPHSPYRPYAPFDTTWGEADDAEKLDEYTEKVRPHIENPVMKRFGMPTRDELLTAEVDADEFVDIELDAYDGSIRGMDLEIGRLLERLRELGLEDRVLLAFVSDHGTEFLDHDRHFHGHSVYGELNRVPLLLWGPGVVPSGVVLEPTVQTIDLMPTVLELAGLEPPARVQGRSLVPLIGQAQRGERQDWPRPAVTEKAVMDRSDLPGRAYASFSLISDGWKLVHNDPPSDRVGAYELYDHRNDPLNLNDLAGERSEKVQELAEKLDTWLDRARAARLDDESLEDDLDAEELERLRSLGYLN